MKHITVTHFITRVLRAVVVLGVRDQTMLAAMEAVGSSYILIENPLFNLVQ